MLGDRQREQAAANTDLKPFYAPTRVLLNSGLLDENDMSYSAEEYTTALDATITFKPRRDMPRYEREGDYVIKPRDCRKGERFRYRDWEDYCVEAEKYPVQRFIKQWSNISKEYFDLAKANSGATIPIACDCIRYNEHLKELYREKYGKEPPPNARLMSIEAEAKGSELATEEYHKRLYEGNIETKLAKSKKNKKE